MDPSDTQGDDSTVVPTPPQAPADDVQSDNLPATPSDSDASSFTMPAEDEVPVPSIVETNTVSPEEPEAEEAGDTPPTPPMFSSMDKDTVTPEPETAAEDLEPAGIQDDTLASQPAELPTLTAPVEEEPPTDILEFPKEATENIERILQEQLEREKATIEEKKAAEAKTHSEMEALELQVERLKEEEQLEREEITKLEESEQHHEEQVRKVISDLEQ